MVLVRGPTGGQSAAVDHVPLEILEVALKEEWQTGVPPISLTRYLER